MRRVLLSPIRDGEQRLIEMLKYLEDSDNLKSTLMLLKIRFSWLKPVTDKSSKGL